MTEKIKLLIIEDHVLTRIGLKTALEDSQKVEVIGESEYGEAGATLVKELEPDVVIMDLGLPNMNGIDATRAIKQTNNDVKVLILTSHDSENEIIGAMASGADAYCMKDISPIKLLSVIESIAKGGMWLDPIIAKTVLSNVTRECSSENREKTREDAPLTEREIEILQLLADGLNNIDIAQSLSVSQHTVKAHICNILQKLSVDDRTQAVARALRQGWIS